MLPHYSPRTNNDPNRSDHAAGLAQPRHPGRRRSGAGARLHRDHHNRARPQARGRPVQRGHPRPAWSADRRSPAERRAGIPVSTPGAAPPRHALPRPGKAHHQADQETGRKPPHHRRPDGGGTGGRGPPRYRAGRGDRGHRPRTDRGPHRHHGWGRGLAHTRGFSVPKVDLVGAPLVLMQNDRLHVAESLKLQPTLVKELLNFRRKININTSNATYEAWREGDHDDLVLSLALGTWAGQNLLRTREYVRAPAALVPDAPIVYRGG